MFLRQPGNKKTCLVSLMVVLASAMPLLAGPSNAAPPGKASSSIAGAGGDSFEATGNQSDTSAATAGKLYKGFLVKQTSTNQGSVTVYVCPHRWVLKTALVSVIVDEDRDRVIAYTKQTNKYLLDTIAVGVKRFKSFRKAGDFSWGKFSVVGKDKYIGETVIVLERKGKRIDMNMKNDVVITEREFSCPRVKVSKTFQDVSNALFDLDFSYGMPLKVSRMAHSNLYPGLCTRRPVGVQDTLFVREQSFPASDFEVPKGLKRVKTEVDLFNEDFGERPEFDAATTNTFVRAKVRTPRMLPAVR
jgi:hypothetical protein